MKQHKPECYYIIKEKSFNAFNNSIYWNNIISFAIQCKDDSLCNTRGSKPHPDGIIYYKHKKEKQKECL